MKISRLLLTSAAVCLPLLGQSAAELEILPALIELHGPQARQQLLAQATTGGVQKDWTANAAWSSENPEIAAVDAGGLVRPVSDGSAVIRVKADRLEARVTVRVTGARDAFSWGFRQHVIPVLTKRGCNSGPCHGAAGGKNGLKLTLRGYDPAADYDVLTREATARRVLIPIF